MIVPDGLGDAGQHLWASVLEAFSLDVGELRLLLEACRTVDELDRLAVALAGAPVEVEGSMGQPRAQPLLDEARKHRALLAALIAALRLPAAGADVGENPTTLLARRAANVRWARDREVSDGDA